MPHSNRRVAAKAAFWLSRRLEALLSVHLTPRSYYSPVADRRWLAQNPDLWQMPLDLGWDFDAQLSWLAGICDGYLEEVAGFPFLGRVRRAGLEFRYGEIEGQLLHCAVRKTSPRLIVEVGCGSSTVISSDACQRNQAEGRQSTRIVAVDPYAPSEIRTLPNVEVHSVPLQAVPPGVFQELHEGDILFLDSTHVLRTGSELHRIYLEILPQLGPGVLVHIHDICLPWMYSPHVMNEFWDWQETALLAALLSGSDKFQVLCSQSALHDARPDQVQTIMPDYRPRRLRRGLDIGARGHFPSSTWLVSR